MTATEDGDAAKPHQGRAPADAVMGAAEHFSSSSEAALGDFTFTPRVLVVLPLAVVVGAVAAGVVVAHADETLRAVADRMAAHELGGLPVVDRHDRHRLLGVTTQFELLAGRLRQLNEERHRERTCTSACRPGRRRSPSGRRPKATNDKAAERQRRSYDHIVARPNASQTQSVSHTQSVSQTQSVNETQYQQLLRVRTGLRHFLRWSEDQARRAGLTGPQHQLLLAVKGHADPRGPTIGDIAEYLALKHHSAVGLIDRADRGGLVERRHDRDDHRMVRLRLTAKGERRLAKLTAQHLDELARLAPQMQSIWQDLGEADPLD